MQWVHLPDRDSWEVLLKRPTKDSGSLEGLVDEVFQAVSADGDKALRRYTQTFDGVALKDILIDPTEIAAASETIPEALKAAIELAYENIYAFHKAQQTPPVHVRTREGVDCWMENRAISHVGLYIPGGSAPLFSTVLMLAIPAKIAGCSQIVLCSPPNKDGE
ncbi:histidinol dehydrogenase, partial [Robiginitalea sp.]